MTKKRVVITGIGTINPIGNTVHDYWENLSNGISGISYIDHFDTTDFPCKIAGNIKAFDPTTIIDKKEARRYSKFVIYAIKAAMDAVKDSGLDIEKEANRIGVEIGSGIGGLEVLEQNTIKLHEKGPSKVSPFTVPMMIVDMASGIVSIKIGAKGPNSSAVSACASSTHSIGNAFRMIQYGSADAMICGGSEAAISPLGIASFCSAKSLSFNNDPPKEASRPFDLKRNGFVMGEGSGILVLEEYEHAKQRNANIYAEVIGYGSSGDAHHITAPAPEGEGAGRAMTDALNDASISTTDIDYINAHGTSTYLNDKNETLAIKDIFKEDAKKIKISSTKSMTGHLLGAAGAIEIIAGIHAIKNNIIPPTINLTNPDPECDLFYTPNKAIEHKVNTVMSNSFGFGGHNAVLIIQKL